MTKRSIYIKQYCKDNRDRFKENELKHRIKWKKVVFDFYGRVCNCCKEQGISFLTIDHVNNDGYKDRKPGGTRISGQSLYKKIAKEGFPDKYQVLCMNCNHSKRINKGTCEHKLVNEIYV